MRLLAITGSHRSDGNSYALSRAVLDSLDCESSIIQLASKKIEYCTICEECVDEDCVLDDDLYEMIGAMERADGVIFTVPRYLSAPSKFMAFLERLSSIVHMRKHGGYGGPPVNPNYELFPGEKPFCVFALSGRGEYNEEALRTVVEYIEYLGMRTVYPERPPGLVAIVKAGDSKGEVLENVEAIETCTTLARKLLASVRPI